MVPSPSGERLIPELDQSDLANFQTRAIIVKIGEGCSENFKNNVNVGDIVDLKPIADLGRYNYSFDKNKAAKFENYFIFPEPYIVMVWK